MNTTSSLIKQLISKRTLALAAMVMLTYTIVNSMNFVVETAKDLKAFCNYCERGTCDGSCKQLYDLYLQNAREVMKLSPKERKYLVIEPMNGWGNKIQALSSGLVVATALKRIFLIDSPLYFDFFENPFLPVPLKYSKHMYKGLSMYQWGDPSWNVTTLKRPESILYWSMASTAFEDIAYRSTEFEVDLKRHVHVNIIRENVMDFEIAKQWWNITLKILLQKPNAMLYDAWTQLKEDIQWDKYPVKIGHQLRSCALYDCGFVVPDDKIEVQWNCIKDYGKATAAENTSTLLYFSVDNPKYKSSAIQKFSDTFHVVSQPVTKRSYKYMNSGEVTDVDKLLPVMLDWYVLSQCDKMSYFGYSSYATTANALHLREALCIGCKITSSEFCTDRHQDFDPHYYPHTNSLEKLSLKQ